MSHVHASDGVIALESLLQYRALNGLIPLLRVGKHAFHVVAGTSSPIQGVWARRRTLEHGLQMVKAHAKATKPMGDGASRRSPLSRADWHLMRVIVFGVLERTDVITIILRHHTASYSLWNVRQLTPLELLSEILLIKRSYGL